MAQKTPIEWADYTANPIAPVDGGWGCSKVSDGCTNCYSERLNKRMGNKRDFVGKWEFASKDRELKAMAKLPPGKRTFVADMTDLFHPDVPFPMIARVFDVMERNAGHTFMLLTKRPGRMAYFAEHWRALWPPNVWAGTSVESQKYAPRLDVLARVPAQVRFVSVEPMLEAVNLSPWLAQSHQPDECGCETDASWCPDARRAGTLSWTIVGGESGPGARPFKAAWAEDIVHQCREAEVACFVKQMGSHPSFNGFAVRLNDRKGGDWDEWPESLRVRQWPEEEKRYGYPWPGQQKWYVHPWPEVR